MANKSPRRIGRDPTLSGRPYACTPREASMATQMFRVLWSLDRCNGEILQDKASHRIGTEQEPGDRRLQVVSR